MADSGYGNLSASQIYRRPGKTVLDYLWVWGNPEYSLEPSCDDGRFGHAAPLSRVNMLGVRNVAQAGHGVPIDPIYADALTKPVAHLDRIVWEVMRDPGGKFVYTHRLETIAGLLESYNNIEGILIDDLSTVGRTEGLTPADLKAFYDSIPSTPDGWRMRFYGVVYTMSLGDEDIGQYIDCMDVVSLWTWAAEDIDQWDKHVDQVHAMAPDKPISIGLYLVNYGGSAALDAKRMQAQCDMALKMLKDKRIFGVTFLLHGAENAEVVKWTRDWIKEVGSEPLTI